MILRIAREKVGHRQGHTKTKCPTSTQGGAFAFAEGGAPANRVQFAGVRAPATAELPDVAGADHVRRFRGDHDGRKPVAGVSSGLLTPSLSHLLKILYFSDVLAMEGTARPRAGTMVVLAFAGTTLSRQVLDRIGDASFRQWTRWTVMTLAAMYLVSGGRLAVA